MRKFGLLAMLTLAATLTFSAVALADDATAPGFTDPAAQSIGTNATGVGTAENEKWTDPDGNTTTFTGQSYRMPVDETFTGGNGGTGFESPIPSTGSIKYDSPKNQVVHSAYNKTSDACASCHAVHTSVNSGALLQWEDPQTACWACHDGTVTSTYDVVNGKHNGVYSSAGLFGTGSELAAEGLSNHGMSPKEYAFVTTSAAPGGAEVAEVEALNPDGTPILDDQGLPAMKSNNDKNGQWNTEFTCIACHDPHGTLGNARVLNPNVNGYASVQNALMTPVVQTQQPLSPATAGVYTEYSTSVSGVNLSNITINGKYVELPQTAKISGNKVTFGTALTDTDVVTADFNQQGETLDGVADGTNKEFKADKGYWMSGHGVDPVVYVNGVQKKSGFGIDYLNGKIVFNTAPAANATVVASYFPGLIVNMDVVGKLTSAETVKYQNGINQFCGACHTDYNNVGKTDGTNGVGGAYDNLLGDYRKAYRHSVGFTRTATTADSSFTDPNSLIATYPGLKFDTSNPKVTDGTKAPTVDCLTCHYAHGTSDEFIKQSLKQIGVLSKFGTIDANGDPINNNGDKAIQTYDPSRTTALKRLPNMGVCQACHSKTGVAPTSTLVAK